MAKRQTWFGDLRKGTNIALTDFTLRYFNTINAVVLSYANKTSILITFCLVAIGISGDGSRFIIKEILIKNKNRVFHNMLRKIFLSPNVFFFIVFTWSILIIIYAYYIWFGINMSISTERIILHNFGNAADCYIEFIHSNEQKRYLYYLFIINPIYVFSISVSILLITLSDSILGSRFLNYSAVSYQEIEANYNFPYYRVRGMFGGIIFYFLSILLVGRLAADIMGSNSGIFRYFVFVELPPIIFFIMLRAYRMVQFRQESVEKALRGSGK